MAKNQYTYAVARIRSMEVSLFSQADIEQLLACRDEKQCLQLLQEKGWGNADTPSDAEAILTCEREKTWAEVGGMIDDMSVFDVLSYPDLFHNLKAAIKWWLPEQRFRVFSSAGREFLPERYWTV